MHRGHENAQKDKDRAKAEVARLNGVVSGSPSTSSAGPSSSTTAATKGNEGTGAYTKEPVKKQYATEAQRKAQLQQLVDMGVAIPDEFRGEMALAGEWQVTEERIVEEDGEKRPDAVALGVRKRAVGEEDEEEQEAKKRRWGSTYKSHPGVGDDGDLDALLSNATRKDKGVKKEEDVVKQETKSEETPSGEASQPVEHEVKSETTVKQEEVKSEPGDNPASIQDVKPALLAEDVTDPAGGVVFKKRKAKNIRQK